MRNIISVNGEFSKHEQERWSALSTQEFFDGELEIETRHDGVARLEKSSIRPVTLTRLYSRHGSLGYRRRRSHIRTNEIGARLIWFVRKGTLHIRRPDGEWDVKGGQIGFTNSNVPFHAKAMSTEGGEYESYQLLVPGALFATHLNEADRGSGPLKLAGAPGDMISNVLTLLARHGALIDRDASSQISEGLLISLLELIKDNADFRADIQGPGEARVAQIKRYIVKNGDDTSLTLKNVAAHYGMSARNLTYLLKQGDTSFSKILWESRLVKACRMLSSEELENVSITDIATMTGFKSAAHFSRMFGSEIGLSPSKYRKIHSKGTPKNAI